MPVVAILTAGLSTAEAARYPIISYTTAEGLPHDAVRRIVPDSSGYLWFCTYEGLARFDGRDFVRLGEEAGLERASFNDLLEATDGTYWAATSRGLFRFRPSLPLSGGGGFEPVPLPGLDPDEPPNRLLQDREGRIWVGTGDGLFVIPSGADPVSPQRLSLAPDAAMPVGSVLALAEDEHGGIWAGTQGQGIFLAVSERAPLRRFDLGVQASSRANNIRGLAVSADGSLWAATFGGLHEMRTPGGDAPPVVAHAYTHVLPSINTAAVRARRRGSLVVSTAGGLVELAAGRSPGDPWSVTRTITTREGLTSEIVDCFAEDASGTLWMGTGSQGAMAMLSGGIVLYDELTGPGLLTHDLLEDVDGTPLVLTFPNDMEVALERLDQGRFRPTRVVLPPATTYLGWGVGQKILHDRHGDWWLATGTGLCRYADAGPASRLATRAPTRCYSTRDGLPADDVFRIFEDSTGDVWISGKPWQTGRASVGRWSRERDRVEPLTTSSLDETSLPSGFAQDRGGNVWIGFFDGRVARYRDGVFELFSPGGGTDESSVSSLHLDSRGRLWLLGRTLARVDDPTAEHPRFDPYRLSPDLVGRNCTCAAEDNSGRIYFGTGRGVVRVDPDSGRSRVFTSRDGLPGNVIVLCRHGRSGGLWFSDGIGVSELIPEPDAPAAPLQARISAVRVAGIAQQVASLGQTNVGPITLPTSGGPVSVEYLAPSATPGEQPRFQFRMAALGAGWSEPSPNRTLQVARMTPGRHRLEVRALAAGSEPLDPVAQVLFIVPAPLWQRWWFLLLAAMLTAALAYAGYRVRVARLLAVERIRIRIASDLHDDIGSSLSQITILSQLARRGIGDGPIGSADEVGGILDRITEVSGALVDTMSDVVWAIAPGRDHLSDLTRRMRRFAMELFAEEVIALELDLPDRPDDPRLPPDLRRQIFLVFKEALHNARRHSGATRVTVRLRQEEGRWTLRVADDGTGIRAGGEGGHGLDSIRRRAASVGGTLEIHSRPGEGMEVVFRS